MDCAWIKIEITCAQSQGGVLVTVRCVYLYVPCSLISNYWNSIHPSSCVEIKFERHFDSADKRHIFQSYNDLTIFQVVQDFFRLFVALLRRTGCWDCPALTGFVDFLDSFVDPILCKFISLISWHYFVCFTITYHTAIQNSTNECQGKFKKTDIAQIHTPHEQADHTGSSSQASPDYKWTFDPANRQFRRLSTAHWVAWAC